MSIVLDIGGGAHKQLGTVGIDLHRLPGVNGVCNCERGLLFKGGSIVAADSTHSIEHMRADDQRDINQQGALSEAGSCRG
ncbi:MAG: hypothetical protein FJY37_01185 [Betaproteobacteria bacterium]|nr:hypothetical protein [Betaproteobacteria bacterium]